MQKAGYTTTQVQGVDSGRYPLSTQTLEFIQGQIMLLQQLGFIGGNRYILKVPDGTNAGIAYIDGELLSIDRTPAMSSNIRYIIVRTTKEDIHADGETYTEAREYRTAYLSTSNNGASESYEIAKFSTLVTNQTLAEQIKQMPTVVMGYLSDLLAEKMPIITKSGLTLEMLNAIKTPCVVNCTASIKVVADAANYSLAVTTMGNDVRQEITTASGLKYYRRFVSGAWEAWQQLYENLHIEAKVVKGTVYLRHGELPSDVSIVLLRKKRRGAFRRTGGSNSYQRNVGKRERRSEKTQYVHYKGIVLSKGTPNSWYVPRCIGVSNNDRDADMLNKEINGCCASFIRQMANDKNGNTVYRMQGVRNRIGNTNGAHYQHHAYVPIAVQVARLNRKGQLTTKESGGEMVYMKYELRRQKKRTAVGWHWTDDSLTQPTDTYRYYYVFYRTITLGQ